MIVTSELLLIFQYILTFFDFKVEKLCIADKFRSNLIMCRKYNPILVRKKLEVALFTI